MYMRQHPRSTSSTAANAAELSSFLVPATPLRGSAFFALTLRPPPPFFLISFDSNATIGGEVYMSFTGTTTCENCTYTYSSNKFRMVIEPVAGVDTSVTLTKTRILSAAFDVRMRLRRRRVTRANRSNRRLPATLL